MGEFVHDKEPPQGNVRPHTDLRIGGIPGSSRRAGAGGLTVYLNPLPEHEQNHRPECAPCFCKGASVLARMYGCVSSGAVHGLKRSHTMHVADRALPALEARTLVGSGMPCNILWRTSPPIRGDGLLVVATDGRFRPDMGGRGGEPSPPWHPAQVPRRRLRPPVRDLHPSTRAGPAPPEGAAPAASNPDTPRGPGCSGASRGLR